MPSRFSKALMISSAIVSTQVFLGPVGAQQRDDGQQPNPDFGYTLRSGLSVGSNLLLEPGGDEVATIWENDAALRYDSETPTSALSLEAGATGRLSDLPRGREADVDDPFAALSFTKEGARSRLSFDANIRDTDLGFIDPLSEPVVREIDPAARKYAPGLEPILTEEGRRRYLQYGTGIVLGVDMPLGLALSADRSETDYRDTTDPDLFDSERTAVDAEARLRLSPVLEGRLAAGWAERIAQDAEQSSSETVSVGSGVDYAIDAVTQVSADLGYTRVEEQETIGPFRFETVSDGVTLGLDLTRELSGGGVSLSYGRSVSETGSRDTLQVGRSLELPHGALAFTLGASAGDATAIVADLELRRDLPAGFINVSLNREIRSDDDGNDVVRTGVAAIFSQEINSLSAFDLSTGYAATEQLGGLTQDDGSLANVEIAYNRTLTRDLGVEVGLEHRWRRETGEADAQSDRLFLMLTLSR